MKNSTNIPEQFEKLVKLRPSTHSKIKSISALEQISMYEMIDKILIQFVEKK